jgi:hypothetical protein
MNNVPDDPKREMRTSLHEWDIVELMNAYPKLSRTEVMDAVAKYGPLRVDVEAALSRLSERKS